MHFQNKRRGIAFALCALMLSLSITSAHTIPVHASTITHASMYKLVDMALAKTGIVANNSIIQTVSDNILDTFGGVVNDYVEYLETTYGDTTLINLETFDAFVNSIGTTGEFIYDMVRTAISLSLDIASITLEELADLLIDVSGEGIIGGAAYVISDDAVEYIRKQFDTYAESEADFYYLKTFGPNDVSPLWFSTKTYYDNFCSFLAQSEYMYEYGVRTSYSGQKVTLGSDSTDKIGATFDLYRFEENFGLVSQYDISDNSRNFYYQMKCYACDDWQAPTVSCLNTSWASYTLLTDDDYELLLENGVSDGSLSIMTKSNLTSKIGISLGTAYQCPLGLFTNDGRYVKVFKDISAFKLYSVGQQSYYINQTNDYSTTNDNSVKFDGTYYEDNATTYSYDIVQNEIDNSTEINEETVNNIVNNTTSTIINNYYGSTGGEGGESGEGDDSTTDYDDEYVKAEISGLGGALIGIALEHYDTLGNVAEAIRDGMTEVTDPINDTLVVVDDTMNNLRDTTENLSGDLTEVSGFMQSLYSFIPEKVMNLLITGSIASIGVGIWWSIRR